MRISVGSARNQEKAGQAINVLERRLQKQPDDIPGREEWGPPTLVEHPRRVGDPETQGAGHDIILEFLRDDLVAEMAKDAVKAGVAYLVWTIVSHLKSQPDPGQVVELSDSRVSLTLTANGLTEEEVALAAEKLAGLLRDAAARRQEAEEPSPSDGD